MQILNLNAILGISMTLKGKKKHGPNSNLDNTAVNPIPSPPILVEEYCCKWNLVLSLNEETAL